MKCSDARPLLDLLCDGALEAKDSALVLDHLKSCDECQHEWNELEQLRSRFHEEKDKTQLPPGLMERISEKLKDEERSENKNISENYFRPISMVAVAATLALLGFLLVPRMHQTDSSSTSSQVASADVLVDDLVSDQTIEPVDRSDLAKKVGYDMKYVRLPEWQIEKSSVYKLHAPTPIARFDFVRKGQSGDQRLSCYQAPQGMIRAQSGNSENLEGKRVFFGNHGKFQFALWTQNGRDYLFVTPLPKPDLEEIVRGA